MKSSVLLWCSLALSLPLLAQADWEQTLVEALDEAALENHQQFGFTQTNVSEEDGVQVSVFDPNAEPQWQLISVDGQSPSEKDLAKFVKQKEAEREDDDTLSDLILPGTVTVQSESEDEVVLAFQPHLADFPKKAQAVMVGTAVWDATQQRLRSIHIHNTEPFSPALSVKIREMTMDFDFIEHKGFTLPGQIRFAFQGKFAGLKNFDVDSSIAFSEFR